MSIDSEPISAQQIRLIEDAERARKAEQAERARILAENEQLKGLLWDIRAADQMTLTLAGRINWALRFFKK